MSRPTVPAHRRTKGFTLIELLIVIAIIGVLAGLMAGAIGYVQNLARRNNCLNNLRQWGGALSLYLDEHRSRTFPTYKKGEGKTDADLWWNALPPYMEEGAKAPFTCICDQTYDDEGATVETRHRSYAMNPWVDSEQNTAPRTKRLRDSQLAFPSQFICMFESSDDAATIVPDGSGGSGSGVESVADYADLTRHGRSTNVLFADGHAATVIAEAAAETTQWNPNKDLAGNDL